MAFKTLPGLTPDGQIYFDEEMAFLEAMLPPGPWATAHGPGLIETPAGVAAFSGAALVFALAVLGISATVSLKLYESREL